MLLITASTDDQSQTEHAVLSISTGLPCKLFSINNGEENKLTSASVIAKVDICFLLASIPIPWAYGVSQGFPGLDLLFVGLPEIKVGESPVRNPDVPLVFFLFLCGEHLEVSMRDG